MKKEGQNIDNIESYRRLADKIILMAVDDYKEALRQKRVNPMNSEVINEASRIEEFFRSDWYIALSSIDGEYLIRRLRKEVDESYENE